MGITASTAEETKKREGTNWLTPKEFSLLEAICDTLLPSLQPPAGSSEALSAYYRRCAHDLHIAELVADKLGQEGPEVQADIRLFLSLFTAPPMGLLLAGSARPFVDLPQEKREQYLLALANSPVKPFRQGFQGLKRLAGLLYFSAIDEQGSNPNWATLEFEAPPPPPDTPQRITPVAISRDTTLEADVVVIGSGAGGGVVAGELARAGKRVVVLEKGGYNYEGNFSWHEEQAMPELFLKRGALSTKDLGVIMLAGETLGGGTVVNWMTSFRTPDDVLAEWEQSSGLTGRFTSSQLQDSFAAVERRIRVNVENSQHNPQNQKLFDGATRLGYHAGVIPRNAVGCEQRCGSCNLGCRYGCSQSTLKTYLQDAYDHEAQILVRCSAEKILIEHGRAVGVQASVRDTRTGETSSLTVRAGVVVVAAGALYSPLLLRRSGIENPHIGRHLRLHPTAISVGVYPEKINAWQGVLQSAYSSQFAHLDRNYGYTLEVAPTHPGLFGLATPWYSARNFRDEMMAVSHLASVIILNRDKGEGSVSMNLAGEPVVDYTVSRYDRKHILHGLRQGARIHLAAGAERVISLQNKPTDLIRSEQESEQRQRLRDFDRLMQRRGLGANRVIMFSAHQMGTCRMGASAKTSVTDEHQRVHGVEGLFVCDSSVFPSACGVNPMLSIMALAHNASQYMKTLVL
ncbi:GMC oxidoreductase [Ktedonospora formicarum]|uniref:long-chain-alcohol oxidase n=2 Tax=Ktedonospora formicarum TaxID=2778364 RepID=A0A8J3I9M4_9CHLR|nr:GMC oxidoreductase [Ktedonospora formicarum]